MKHVAGWALGVAVKTPLGMPTSRVGVPEFESWLHFQFSSFLLMCTLRDSR